MAGEKKRIKLTQEQWDEVERMYRANQLQLSQIAERFGVSVNAIAMRAKRKGWKRNLGRRIREEIRQRVSKDMAGVPTDSEEFEDQCVIEEAADMGISLIKDHQMMFKDHWKLAKDFIIRLRETRGDMDPKDWSVAHKNAVSVIKDLVALTRQAYNLDEAKETDGDAESKVNNLLDYIHENGSE